MTPLNDDTAQRWMRQFLAPHFMASTHCIDEVDDVILVDRDSAPEMAGRLGVLAAELARNGRSQPLVINATREGKRAATPGEVHIQYHSMFDKQCFYELLGKTLHKAWELRNIAGQATSGDGFQALGDVSGLWTDQHTGKLLDPETLRTEQYRTGWRSLN